MTTEKPDLTKLSDEQLRSMIESNNKLSASSKSQEQRDAYARLNATWQAELDRRAGNKG